MAIDMLTFPVDLWERRGMPQSSRFLGSPFSDNPRWIFSVFVFFVQMHWVTTHVGPRSCKFVYKL